jgi:GNAT superfamily N-acetyltransferase
MTGTVTLRDLEIGDAGWLIEQHGVLYARDDGFDATFEALVAEILAAYIRDRDPKLERAFIAVEDGRRLGSVFCVRSEEPGVAKLRLFLLLPEARGMGLGKQLLDACLGFARGSGIRPSPPLDARKPSRGLRALCPQRLSPDRQPSGAVVRPGTRRADLGDRALRTCNRGGQWVNRRPVPP